MTISIKKGPTTLPKRINHIQLANFSKVAVKNLLSSRNIEFLFEESSDRFFIYTSSKYYPSSKIKLTQIPFLADPAEFTDSVTDALLNEITNIWAYALQISNDTAEELLALIDGFPPIEGFDIKFSIDKGGDPLLRLTAYGHGSLWKYTHIIGSPEDLIRDYEKIIRTVQEQLSGM